MSTGYLEKTSEVGGGLPYVDKPDPWSSHTRIKRMLEDFQPGTRVLDVGAATGMIGRMCDGLGLRMTGIEPNAKWAATARHYYEQIMIATLDQIPEDNLSGYDVVILADVLEHMPNPEVVLARLVKLQQPQSTFVISVPNVANFYIRLSLLFGRFNYADRGIMDRTHLKFFTRASLLGMMRLSGIEVEQVIATPIPLGLVHPIFTKSVSGRFIFRCLAGLTTMFPTFFGYQFIIRGKARYAS